MYNVQAKDHLRGIHIHVSYHLKYKKRKGELFLRLCLNILVWGKLTTTVCYLSGVSRLNILVMESGWREDTSIISVQDTSVSEEVMRFVCIIPNPNPKPKH